MSTDFPKDCLFQLHVFGRSLDYQISVGNGLFQVQHRMNSRQSRLNIRLVQLAFLDESLEAFADHAHASINETLLDVSEIYVVLADLSGYLSNSMAHQASTQNCNSLDFSQCLHLFSRQRNS